MLDTSFRAVRELLAGERFGCRIVVVAGPDAFEECVVDATGAVLAGSLPNTLRPQATSDARSLMSVEQSRTLRYGDNEVYFEVVAPRPRLLVFGAVHIAQALLPMAVQLGFTVSVSDARQAFISRERFPDADELLVGWPGDLGDALRLDERTFVVVLSHDARYEDPLWPLVLPSPVRYIGAMGSRKTSGARRERLLAEGYSTDDLDRIHGPIGLDIGAEAPEEIAIAILGEIISVRYGAQSSPQLIGEPVRLGKSEYL